MGVFNTGYIDKIFYEAFLDSIETDPEWLEYFYGVPIEDIQADPRKYYALDDVERPAGSPVRPKPSPAPEKKQKYKAVGLL